MSVKQLHTSVHELGESFLFPFSPFLNCGPNDFRRCCFCFVSINFQKLTESVEFFFQPTAVKSSTIVQWLDAMKSHILARCCATVGFLNAGVIFAVDHICVKGEPPCELQSVQLLQAEDENTFLLWVLRADSESVAERAHVHSNDQTFCLPCSDKQMWLCNPITGTS